MRLKSALIPIVVLLSSMMIATVSAIPQTTIEVSANQPSFTTTYTKLILNDGGIFHYAGVGTGKVYLTVGTTTYELKLTEEFSTAINTKTDQGESHRVILWEYIVGGQVLGTFEGTGKGVTHTTLYNPTGYPRGAFSTNIYHAVLQGSGIFDAQTLKLDGIRLTADPTGPVTAPANPTTWTGILLTH